MGNPEPAILVRDLSVDLPNGRSLLNGIHLEVNRGEVVVLVGGSGSGKSTLSQALCDPEQLKRDGFTLQFDTLTLNRNDLGVVHQRGALFDHLTVGGNIELALRAADTIAPGTADKKTVGQWLNQVNLDSALAASTPDTLSGGQAQRVAVARTLAAGRQILFLDEPSVGLDPARVRDLARIIREQVESQRLASIVVTHDIALAAEVGDRILFLDGTTGTLTPLLENQWPGPLFGDDIDPADRARWRTTLDAEIVSRITASVTNSPSGSRNSPSWKSKLAAFANNLMRPFAIAALAISHLPRQLWTNPRDFATVSRRVAMQTLIRPLPFYALVATLIGYTILFVISKVGGAGIRPDALVRQIGGSYVLALGPPLSAILFVAASGAATNAWLGSATLTRQVSALKALGINPQAYLWSPTWPVLAISYLLIAALVCASMLLGGWLLASQIGVTNAAELLTSDFLDPRPERAAHLSRAIFLIWIYGWGIASDVVAKGTSAKNNADAVTRSMTSSVVSCTLWVVAWELTSAVWLFR